MASRELTGQVGVAVTLLKFIRDVVGSDPGQASYSSGFVVFLNRACLICSLFKDAYIIRTYYLCVTSNDWLEVKNTLESRWKESAAAEVRVQRKHFIGLTEETDDIPQLG